MSSSEAGPLATYNSLTDKHLCGFFRNARTQRHLRRMGLITKRGEVVSEEMFRISHARREHKKHVRELLAQAIVHKTLDLERTRQIQIRNRLEEMAKRELVERVRSERSMKGDEDILTLMSPRSSKPRDKSADQKRRRVAPKGEKSDENSFLSDDNSQPPRAATTASNTRSSRGRQSEYSDGERPISNRSSKSKTNFEIDANGLPVYRKSDEVDSQYLSRLTPRALRQFTMSLNNIDYMSGVSPYVLPQVEPTPPSRQKSFAGGSPRSSAKCRSRRVASLHPPHEDVQHPRRLETQVKVTMKYLGLFKHKGGNNERGGGTSQPPKSDSPYAQGQQQPHPPPRRGHSTLEDEEPAEVMLLQQHCGGNTFRVFKGLLYRNNEFDFFSKRHRGFPFSITLYINGKADSRISTCCEFKHCPKGDKTFVKLGGKLGRFAFGKAESPSNEGMCYRCKAEAKLDEKEKGKAEDDYDEDFQESSNEDEVEESDYKVVVYTGDQAGAGTDANVEITLVGESGDTGPVKLDRKGKNDFERGRKDVFDLKLKEVGKVKKLTVSHDGSGFASAWFLEKIVVDHNEKKTTFYCNKWLSDYVDDKIKEITLTPGAKPPPVTTYYVTVYTGSVDKAGTDADVYISISGKNGNSGTKLLDKAGKNDFERNSQDEYKIKCQDLGKIESLKIWHDGSGLASAWFLDKVVVERDDSKTFFYCHDWLADNMDGKSLSRELKPGPSEVEYKLIVHTGDKSGAGTDADVFIQMYGQGDINSGIKHLDKSGKDDFERASVGEYQIFCPDLGKLEKLKVWHDGSGLGSDWYLEKIEVCQPGGNKVVFKCRKWLSDSQDDEKTERVLEPSEEDTTDDVTEEEIEKEKEKEKELSESSASSSTSSFSSDEEQKQDETKPKDPKPEPDDDCRPKPGPTGEPDDPSRPKPGPVDEPDDPSRPKPGPADEPDDPSRSETKPEENDVIEYELVVYTGDVSGAGTDSDVYVLIYGENGDSGAQNLDAKFSDDFERGSKGNYSFKLKDLGKLNKLRVWHDGSGIGSGWFLEKIVVTSQSTTVVFECNKWLDEDKEDGKTERILYPSSPLAPELAKPDNQENLSQPRSYQGSYLTERISDDDDDDDFDITPVSPRKPSEPKTAIEKEPEIVPMPEDLIQKEPVLEVSESSDSSPDEAELNDVIEPESNTNDVIEAPESNIDPSPDEAELNDVIEPASNANDVIEAPESIIDPSSNEAELNDVIEPESTDVIEAPKSSNVIGNESNDVTDAPLTTQATHREVEERSSANQMPSKWDDKANFKDSQDVYKSVDFDDEKQSTPETASEKDDFDGSDKNQLKEESSAAHKPEKGEKSSSVFTMERDSNFRNSVKANDFPKDDEEPTASLDQSEATMIEIDEPKKDSSGSQMISDSLDLPEGKPKPDDPTEVEVSSESSSNKAAVEIQEPIFPNQKKETEEFQPTRMA